MPGVSNEELAKRISELEEENRALKNAGGTSTPGPLPISTEPTPRKQSNWPRTLLATVLIVVGAFLARMAIAASWAKIELTATDRFVAAYAPLADNPAVQAFVADEASQAIDEHIDVRKMTSDVIDGVTALGTGPLATKALDSMKGPAAAGFQNLMHSTVANFVASGAFAAVWKESLRVSHTQFAGAMQNDPNAALQVDQDGSLGMELSPVIAAIKKSLMAQGIDFSSQIPEVNRTVVVAQSDAVPKIQLAYGLAVAAGSWLPWVSLLFLVAGVLVARRKAVALIWAAIALTLVMSITVAALAAGNIVFIASASPTPLPGNVAGPVYTTVVGLLQTLSVAILVLAVAVAVVAWYSGPFRTPQRLRGFFGAARNASAKRVREAAQRNGISTGRTGEWLYRQRLLLRIAVAVVGALVILFTRPLTAGVIIWTLVVAVVVVAVLELLQRPAGEALPAVDAETRVPVA